MTTNPNPLHLTLADLINLSDTTLSEVASLERTHNRSVKDLRDYLESKSTDFSLGEVEGDITVERYKKEQQIVLQDLHENILVLCDRVLTIRSAFESTYLSQPTPNTTEEVSDNAGN